MSCEFRQCPGCLDHGVDSAILSIMNRNLEAQPMKAIEFESQLTPDQSLSVPPSVAKDIPASQPVRVLVLIPDSNDEQHWEHLAAIDFGQGYTDSDAIYDKLSGG
jgi:hypothetical protein